MLTDLDIKYEELDITGHKDQHHIQCALNIHTGFFFFPNIYFGNFHVGGYDDFMTYFTNKEALSEILMNENVDSNLSSTGEFSDGFSSSSAKVKASRKMLIWKILPLIPKGTSP